MAVDETVLGSIVELGLLVLLEPPPYGCTVTQTPNSGGPPAVRDGDTSSELDQASHFVRRVPSVPAQRANRTQIARLGPISTVFGSTRIQRRLPRGQTLVCS